MESLQVTSDSSTSEFLICFAYIDSNFVDYALLDLMNSWCSFTVGELFVACSMYWKDEQGPGNKVTVFVYHCYFSRKSAINRCSHTEVFRLLVKQCTSSKCLYEITTSTLPL